MSEGVREARFTIECGRLQLGQVKRELRSAAHWAGLDVTLDEAKTLLDGCTVFVTVRGTEPVVTAYLRGVDQWVEANKGPSTAWEGS